jgi:predicted ATPase
MAMDALFRALERARVGARRVHFHAFMADAHARLFALGARSSDGCATIGAQLARAYRCVCVDDVEIADVADAMVFKRVMETYVARGGTLIATSNAAPERLYRGGINRAAFAPFIQTLREACEIVDLTNAANVDYRRAVSSDDDDGVDGVDASTPTVAFADGASSSSSSRAFLTRAWDAYASLPSSSAVDDCSLEIALSGGRSIRADARSGDRGAWFSFAAICGGNFGPIDYLAIARRFKVVCVENVPSLPIFEHAENEARRFINLIDVLYETDCVLLASFASATSPDDIFQSSDRRQRANSDDNDGGELTLRQRTALESNQQQRVAVSALGGSSGRSTTMTSETTEWSATGRFGAALAHVQSENFTANAAPRAVSRIAHMSTPSYVARALRAERAARSPPITGASSASASDASRL